jgi:PAS domain S-box-containing protein
MWEAFAAAEQAVYDTVPVNETVYGDLFPDAIESVSYFPLGDHGVLILGSRGSGGFDDTDLHLANVVATTTTAALDSTERRRELERRDTIVEAVGDGVYALDSEGRYTAVNDTLLSRTGYAREELLGEHVSALLGPEEIKRGRRLIAELRDNEDESVKTYEASIRTKDGDRIPCEVNLSLLPADEGFVGTVGTVRDVSERKNVEDALRQQKRTVRNLHQVASQLDSCETPSAIYEYAVRAAQQVLNFDICAVQRIDGDETVIASVSPGPLPDDMERRREFGNDLTALTYRTHKTYRISDIRNDDVAAQPSEDYRAVLSVPIGDQGVFQAISTSVGAFDESDEELAELLIAHVENALDRVQFETDLREERDRFAALFENVPDAVASVRNEDGRTVITDVNEAFERIFGYTADEIAGRPLEETIIPPEGVDKHREIKRRATAGETVEREITRRTVDGLREFMLNVVPVDIGAKDSERYAVYTDITERKQRRKRVEVLNRVLRHDLRNGMNIIRGNAEMLRGEVPADLTTAVDAIEDRTTELIEMAEKTRLVERTLRDGTQTTGPVDVNDAVTTVVEQVRDEHPESTVECSCPDSAHASASSLLQTAVYHVVENAIVHNDGDAPQVEVIVRREEESVVVKVRDDGPGLPRTERELLVEDREITQLRHAGGLGLWLVNWVVQQSGGTLSFADNEPRGSVVTLQFPQARLNADIAGTGTEESDA